MAFWSQKLASFLTRFSRARTLSVYSPASVVSFSSPEAALNCEKDEPTLKSINTVDESRVLDQLSHLLPIRRTPLVQNNLEEKHLEKKGIDDYLSPEEKLRGVFLQKLCGRFAIERALTNVNVELTLDVVSKVVSRGNLGWEAMLLFFNWAIEQPTVPKEICTYHIFIKALGRRKFFTCMVKMLHDMRMKGMIPNSETLYIVMDSFIRARQVSKATQMFSKLEEFGWKCDIESLNVLLLCLCQRSHVGVANSLLNKMKEKVVVNSKTYNAIISGWSRYGRVDKIERTLEEMVAGGIDPDNSTYSYVLEGFGRAGRINDSVKVFEELKKEVRSIDVGVYNAIIYNFISVGDFDEISKYYELMIKNNCEPNIETYVRLVSAFLKARKVADAIEMFDEMLGRGIIPSTGTITTFIEPLCSYGPPHAAMMIYKKARKVGCIISLSAYKMLFMRLSRFGKCGMLFKLWNELQESGYSPDMEVYGHVINGLCNIGQFENAVLVMEEALHRGFCPDNIICSKLNNKLLTSNKVEMAYKLHLKVKAARSSENARRHWRAKGWHF